nr:hypothetical protein CFP56_24247 [Quercus suber]
MKPNVPPSSRRITAFFKPYTVPKDKVPANTVAEDEIVLVQPCAAVRSGLDPQEDNVTTSAGELLSNAPASFSLVTPPGRAAPLTPATARTITAADIGDLEELATPGPERSGAVDVKHAEVRSPKTHTSAMSLPKSTDHSISVSTVNTSFSSISTLTTLSSQSSSRRILKSGEMAITNSDSDDQSDSSDELADVFSLVPRKRVKLTPPVEQGKPEHGYHRGVEKSHRENRRYSGQDMKSAKTSPRVLSPPRTVYKHSLKNMIKQNKKVQASKARIADAEAAVQAAESRRAALAEMNLGQDDSLRLASAAATDDDEGVRVMRAMGRMEAIMQEEEFHYFASNASIVADFPFPTSGLPDGIWAKLLSENHTREQACLTGFVSDLASEDRLSAAMIEWFAVHLALEPSEDLCEAYIGILQAASQNKSMQTTLTSLNAFYLTRFSAKGVISQPPPVAHVDGAEYSGVRHNQEDDRKTKLPNNLEYVIRGLEYLAPIAGTSAVSEAVANLALANIDTRVKANSALWSSVQNTVIALLDHAEDLYEFVRDHLHNIPSLSLALQRQIVIAFPASSARAHALRRRLALFCITQSGDDLLPSNHEWQALVLDHLQHASEFAIDRGTDYVLLKSLAQVLDIAIDAGFSDRRGWTNVSPENPQQTASLFPSSLREGVNTASPQKVFNDQIDALTAQLATMQNHIKDGGMSHLLRMEAKSSLHALEMRLQSSVRTKPKPIKAVFGTRTSSTSSAMQSAVLDAFLSRNNTDKQDELKTPTNVSFMPHIKENQARSERKGVRFAIEEEDSSGSDNEST